MLPRRQRPLASHRDGHPPPYVAASERLLRAYTTGAFHPRAAGPFGATPLVALPDSLSIVHEPDDEAPSAGLF
jgi:hypothetical protein